MKIDILNRAATGYALQRVNAETQAILSAELLVLVSYHPLARDSSVGGQVSWQAAGVIGTNQRRKSDRRAKRGRRGDDGPVRVSRREEGPVNKAGYATVAENRVVEEKVQMKPNKRASVLGR